MRHLRQLQHLTGTNLMLPRHVKEDEITQSPLGKHYFLKNNCFLKLSALLQLFQAVYGSSVRLLSLTIQYLSGRNLGPMIFHDL